MLIFGVFLPFSFVFLSLSCHFPLFPFHVFISLSVSFFFSQVEMTNDEDAAEEDGKRCQIDPLEARDPARAPRPQRTQQSSSRLSSIESRIVAVQTSNIAMRTAAFNLIRMAAKWT